MAMEADCFEQVPVEEVINCAESWDLPEEYAVILRVYNKQTGRVKEKAYKTFRGADNFLEKLNTTDNDVTLYDSDDMRSSVGPKN
jgi:hypothetical protein